MTTGAARAGCAPCTTGWCPAEPARRVRLGRCWVLVVFGGRDRTEAEYRGLLAAAGFRLTRVVPTTRPMSVIEAVAA